MAERSRVVIVLSFIVLAATAASAQPNTQSVSDEVVTRSSRTAGGEEVVIESYWPSLDGGRLAVWQRVRRLTTVTPAGTETVEETETRPRGSVTEPLRMFQRSVTTVRKTGPDSYVTERRVFEYDVNGRFFPVLTEVEHTTRK